MYARFTITMLAATFATLSPITPAFSAQVTDTVSTGDADGQAEDLIRRRLQQMGIDPEHWDNAIGRPSTAGGTPPPGVTYTKRWEFDGITSMSNTAALALDLEGNLLVATGSTLEKINGAENDGAMVQRVWPAPVQTNFIGGYPSAIVTDLDNNAFVCGGSGIGSYTPWISKVNPQGFTVWSRTFPPPAGELGENDMDDVRLGPDGVPFAVSGPENPKLYRFDPVSGGIAWRVELEDPAIQTLIPDLRRPRMEVDRMGNVYVLADVSEQRVIDGLNNANDRVVVAIDGASGRPLWSAFVNFGLERPEAVKRVIATDFDCNVNICGHRGDDGLLVRFDAEGNLLEERVLVYDDFGGNMPAGYLARYNVIKALPDGTLLLGGRQFLSSGSPLNLGYLTRIAPDGTRVWNQLTQNTATNSSTAEGMGLVRRVWDIEFDQYGNVYALTQTSGFISSEFKAIVAVQRFDGETGARNWGNNGDQLFPEGVIDSVTTIDLAVDRGGSVYASVFESDFSGPDQATLVKYTQPIQLTPTRICSSPELRLENRSVWSQGVGSLQEDFDLFTFGPNETDPILGYDIWPVDINLGGYVLGTGGELTIQFNGTIDTGFRAEIDGGTADIHLPFEIEWLIPNPETLNTTNQPVTITSQWTPDPAARLVTCVEPELNVGFTAGGSFGALINVYGQVLGFEIFNEDLLNRPTRTLVKDYIPGFNLVDLVQIFGRATGKATKVTIEDPRNLIQGYFSVPTLSSSSLYSPVTNSFTTNVDPTEKEGTFLGIKASITEAIAQSLGGRLTFEYELPDGGSDPDLQLEASAALLQLRSGLDARVGQSIKVETTPTIRYTFPGTSIPDQVLEAGEDLVFPLPASRVVDIIPFVETPTTFSNQTSFAAVPTLNFEAFRFATAATVLDVDIFGGIDFCLGCFDWDISEILNFLGLPGDLVDIVIKLPAYTWNTNSFPTIQLPCIRIVGDLTQTPRLISASRSAMDMIIYDQTSPSQVQFNVATEGVDKMLLYGEEFTNSQLEVYIEHNGRIEVLTPGNGLTHINDFTLLIEMPKLLRLTPGVARIWVENVIDGTPMTSETIDLPIEYPAPRLDAVNPNLWAADPELATVPVSVIDAKSFMGNDTFIARRDYWIKMRDDLWTSFTAGGLTAQEYFPLFDFDRIPGFPAVLWKTGLVNFEGLTFTDSPPSEIVARPSSAHNVSYPVMIEAVVRPSSSGDGGTILTTENANTDGLRLRLSANGGMTFTSFGIRNYDTEPGLVPNDVWSHVAAVAYVNNGTTTVDFYLNGQFVERETGSANFIAANPDAQVVIGAGSVGNADRFEGELAEVRFWNVQRSAEDIRTYTTRRPMSDEPGLIGYWPLNGFEDFGDDGVGTPGPNDVDDRSFVNAIADAINISGATTKVFYPDSVEVTPQPLPRFVQPVDNGIYNVRLMTDLYERPQIVRVALCNPGPGGGMSDEYTLTIAAPRPVMSGIQPSSISPLDIPADPVTLEQLPLEITVRGPINVPIFDGFEEPKRGNFNRDSVVHFNGVPLETAFNNSDMLIALLPPELITEGEHIFHVATPSNGTQYFEQLFRDQNGDGEPDDEDPGTFGIQPFQQMLVDSGGVSNPVFFRVRYEDPVIERIFPAHAEQDSPTFDAGATVEVDLTQVPGIEEVVMRTTNMTISGQHFRPGATVYFDDQPRNAEVVNPTCIRVELLPEDVDVVGTYEIVVLNPGNPPAPSAPAMFDVLPVPPSALSARESGRRKPATTKPSN